jgi:hypothetical protein
VGVMMHGAAVRNTAESELGVNYKLYMSNNQFEGNSQSDRLDAKSWGGRVQVRLPAMGRLRRFDIAGDLYRGRIGLDTEELVEDHVYGFDSQIDFDRFELKTEYARGRTLGRTRYGYYVQPGVRVNDAWVGFYRVEALDSPRIQRSEIRHTGGVNFRPFAQIAMKAEIYRVLPQARAFIESEEERRKYSGFAAAAVFFF